MTEYLRCDFSNIEIAHNEELEICIGDKILQPKDSFRYLRSMLHKSEMIDEDVAHSIKAAWLKWRAAIGVIYDRNVPLKLKGKFYRVTIRPAMLYESECWPITKALANRMEVAELRMLRWTCGKMMLDMIPNGVYRAELEVETIINKMREGRLRRGRPKLRWEDRVKLDMKELLLSKDMTSNRNEWRARIRLGGDLPLSFAQRDLVIYEMHVRGFTRHESSKTESRGTYLGVVDKLDHLKVLSNDTLLLDGSILTLALASLCKAPCVIYGD
ncbi:ataxia telangiectasia mutated family protein [Tanacetum coccineum]